MDYYSMIVKIFKIFVDFFEFPCWKGVGNQLW